MDESSLKTITCPPPPRFFDPAKPPKFLAGTSFASTGPQRTTRETPRSKPTAVVAAAAATLAKRAEQFQYDSAPLALERDARCDLGPECGGVLRFGDALQILRDGDRAALSTVPAGCAAEVEDYINGELLGSGRDPEKFTPVNAVLNQQSGQDAGMPSRRSVWELHRFNPLDGFPDGIVHYGQLLRIGQKPSITGPSHLKREEILLSCEPPRRGGGADAPYMVLGRFAPFGHPDVRIDPRKAFNTVFRLLPARPRRAWGAVDLRDPVLIAPAAPASYSHKARILHVAPSCEEQGKLVPMLGGLRVSGELKLQAGVMERPVVKMPARKHLRSDYSQQTVNASWLIECLALRPGSLAACDWRREQQHTGYNRALIGRCFPTPAPCTRGGSYAAAESQDTRFSRWERIRSAVLPRLGKRGVFGFANLRKAMTVLGEGTTLAPAELGKLLEWPDADEPLMEDTRCVLRMEDVESVLVSDCGIQLLEDDLALIAHVFVDKSSRSLQQGGTFIDADMFLDALRGEASPGRYRCLSRLYTMLQDIAGVDNTVSLDAEWIQTRLWQSRTREKVGATLLPFSPDDIMGTLPLLRTTSAVSRLTFIRCAADIAFNIPGHADFVTFVREVWGCPAGDTANEAEYWNFQDAVKRASQNLRDPGSRSTTPPSESTSSRLSIHSEDFGFHPQGPLPSAGGSSAAAEL